MKTEQIMALLAATKALLNRDQQKTCQHEDTHRGGAIWEICDSCDRKWSDDRDPKPEWKDPPEWEAAHAAIDAIEAALKEREGAAYNEAKSLAEALFKKHFSQEPHYASGEIKWGLCDSTAGIISQIDNMVSGLVLAPPKAQPMTDAVVSVLAERQRQISDERWAPEHDDTHSNGQLAHAASAYAHEAGNLSDGMKFDTTRRPPFNWPWHSSYWKVADSRRMLVKAGALILAEIERIDRAERHHGIGE